jgi:hypothetical protein
MDRSSVISVEGQLSWRGSASVVCQRRVAPCPRIEENVADRLNVAGSIFDRLHFDIDALADLAPITNAGGEQLARFFRGLGLDAPLLHACDLHGRVKGLERGLRFEGGNGHGRLRDESHADKDSSLGCRHCPNGDGRNRKLGHSGCADRLKLGALLLMLIYA